MTSFHSQSHKAAWRLIDQRSARSGSRRRCWETGGGSAVTPVASFDKSPMPWLPGTRLGLNIFAPSETCCWDEMWW